MEKSARDLEQEMIDLDDLSSLAQLDRGGMLAVLEDFPDQCERALALGAKFPVPDDFAGIERVVTTGMGGSGIAGDLLASLIRLPVIANRGYRLPPVDEGTLVVGLSYSGDTEETLSSLGMALGQGARVLCISSGGELERLAAREALPFVKVPAGLQPRAALGYLLLPILKVLSRIGLLEQELDHLPEALRRAAAGWGPEVPVEANRAKRLAGWLYRKIPVIYGVEGTTAAVALRWKTQINENGKQPAFWNSVPELCHNEIVALERADLLPHMRVVLLRSPLDHQQNQRRIEIMQELLEERGIDHEEVSVEADGKLLQLLSLVYLGDLVSVYLALQGGVDPTPVKLIVDFKERLRQFP